MTCHSHHCYATQNKRDSHDFFFSASSNTKSKRWRLCVFGSEDGEINCAFFKTWSNMFFCTWLIFILHIRYIGWQNEHNFYLCHELGCKDVWQYVSVIRQMDFKCVCVTVCVDRHQVRGATVYVQSTIDFSSSVSTGHYTKCVSPECGYMHVQYSVYSVCTGKSQRTVRFFIILWL